MAESTVGITFTAPGTEPKVYTADLDALSGEDKAIPPRSPESRKVEIVSCGTPLPGHEVQIVDEQGCALTEDEVGEVITRGPSVMSGYYMNEEESRKALRNGWLHTGDLGFFHQGELYLCGRRKELIILSGRNYYPADIEWVASQVKGIRVGNVIAFSIGEFSESDEKVVLCAETRENESEFSRLEKEIISKVLATLGLLVREILFVPPGTLPKTSSGKLQRTLAKRMYLQKTAGSTAIIT